MSGITAINRITGSTNNLVYLVTSDATATALAANYITAQAANILAVSDGGWTWLANDEIMLSASDGNSWCSINSTFTTLFPMASAVNPYAIQYVPFTLTAAQWNGMDATPVLIIPAQGAGTIIIPDEIEFELIYGGTQFTGGGAVGFQYGNTAALAGTLATNTEQATDFTGATANTIYKFGKSTGNGSQVTKANGNNVGIYISNNTAAFATGNSTFSGIATYRVYPIS